MSLAACTIISKNYLAYARTLAESFQQHHPGCPFFVLLVDRVDGCFEPAKEPFELIEIGQLDIPNLPRFCFQYSILELNTAVKPYFLRHLLGRPGVGRLVYFDPDIVVLRPLAFLPDLLDRASVVLTPHVTRPIGDERKPTELDILQAGVYNLGFLALSATATADELLRWWSLRLYDKCLMAREQGMHVDQRWMDLVPGFFDDVHILRDPGCNVAYWNLQERAVRIAGDTVMANGAPCYFFHFSGFNPDDVAAVSRHQDRFTLKTARDAAHLYTWYAGRLREKGYDESSRWPYAFGRFANGVPIPDFVRGVYRRLPDAERFGDPFAVDRPDSFIDWLRSPVPGSRVSRLWHVVFELRSDLQQAYPDVLRRDQDAFIAWTWRLGRQEHGISDALMVEGRHRPSAGAWLYRSVVSPLEPKAKRLLARVISRDGWAWGRLKGVRNRLRVGRRSYADGASAQTALDRPFGVNVGGYFESEKGVGEAGRASVRALRAAGIPHVLNNVVDSGSANVEAAARSYSEDNPFAVNLLHVNADQVPVVGAVRGEAYFRGRYNVGYWFWELSQFPDEWLSSFAYFDEVWVGSNFVLDAVARVSPVPVVKIPLALEDAPPPRGRRSDFDLPEDRFVFLFMFDFHSFIERKNPLGLIEAFRRAFADRDDVLLALKSSHSRNAPGTEEVLEAVAGAPNVTLIDGVLRREEVRNLVALSDCYVSLHRSEGFGLPIAEAMAQGKPVIVTAYSGNMDFTTPANSLLVRHKLIQIERDHGPYRKGSAWADPDLDHAAELMLTLREDQGLAGRLGAQARADIPALYHPDVIAAQLQERLTRITSRRRSRGRP